VREWPSTGVVSKMWLLSCLYSNRFCYQTSRLLTDPGERRAAAVIANKRMHADLRIHFIIHSCDSRPTSEAVDNVEEQLAIEIGDQCREILTNNWPGPVVVLVKTDPPSTADPRARACAKLARKSSASSGSSRSDRAVDGRPSRALSLSTFWSGNPGQRQCSWSFVSAIPRRFACPGWYHSTRDS